MTIAPGWLLRAAGHDRARERALAEASRRAERDALVRETMADETRLVQAMTRVERERHVTLGATATGVPYRIALDDLVSLPSWITAGTGSGKSRFVGSIVASILPELIRGAPVAITVIDGKGETIDHLLRSLAALVEALPASRGDAVLQRLHTLRFFGRRYLPSWPLLTRLPGVAIGTQADAVAEVLTELTTDATVGPRQRSTLAAILALAIEFGLPAAALPWLLAAPAEVAAFAMRSSVPSVRLDLSRFDREPSGSIDGLIARLGILLRAGSIKAVLSGETPFDFGVCFEPGSITALGFDGADLGARAAVRALGSLAISAFANAAFDPRRSVRGKTLIVIDEPQTFLTSVSLAQLERLVTLGRSFGAGAVALVHQGASQLPDEFRQVLGSNVATRVLGRSSEQDAWAAAEWLPRTGRVLRRQESGRTSGARPRFLSESEERRFRVEELGRLQARHFLVADRRAGFAARIVRAPDYDPPSWAEIHPTVADAVERGSSGVPRETLELRVRQVEEAAAARFEAGIDDVTSRRRGRAPKTPDVVGTRSAARRGEVP